MRWTLGGLTAGCMAGVLSWRGTLLKVVYKFQVRDSRK